MLTIGRKAPPFALPSTAGKTSKLADFAGQKLVLYFYPRDLTPGCTQEACDFRDAHQAIAALGASVVGISKDSLASHQKFQTQHGFDFPLLVDADNAVAKAYGAYGDKVMYGKTVQGTIRSTFLIDEEGRIAAIWSPVRVKGHVDAVLQALRGEVDADTVRPRATPSTSTPTPKKRK